MTDGADRVGIYSLEPRPSSCGMPTDHELRRLLDLVGRKYPGLFPRDLHAPRDLDAYLTAARTTFAWLCVCPRRVDDTVDRTRYVSFWTEIAESWARSVGLPSQDLGRTLFVTAICHGDIPFQLPADGWSPSLGLGYLIGKIGKPASGRWRPILAGEAELLPPISPQQFPDGHGRVGPGNLTEMQDAEARGMRVRAGLGP